MPVMIVFLILSLLGFAFGLVIRIAGMLRLGIPLTYTLIVAFFFPAWSHDHPILSMGILYALLAFCLLSWIITAIRKIRQHLAERRMAQWEAEMLIEGLKRKQGMPG
ncbi:MAG: hypothetical protein K6A39_06945 [Clostridiales bacterium]|nr:hypothetical protein [Clostridiales bacterium]